MHAFEDLNMTNTSIETTCLASINGITLHGKDQSLSPDELRQRACSELLRQAAVAQGLLPADDRTGADGTLSEAASAAIEVLLEKNLPISEPSDEACQRHYNAHLASFSTGERVRVRHILFAVTQGLEVSKLRQRAETCLLNVRCHDGKGEQDTFASDAKALSNCPSGADSGDLGWLTSADCAPEFAKELFGNKEVGVLPRLVHSRFGLHVVEILERQAGQVQTFESVRGAVAMTLRQKTFVTALRQYLAVLSGSAEIEGVDMDAAESPLVQ